MLYRLLWLVAQAINKVYFRVRVEGKENLPTEGGYVVAPVHRSWIDFILITSITHKPMRFMAKDSAFKYPMVASVLSRAGSFPVNRGTPDRAAMSAAKKVLEAREVLVIFPEGTRREGPTVEALFDGVSYLVYRCASPVVPVGILGSDSACGPGVKFPRPRKVRIRIGTAIEPPAAQTRVTRRELGEFTIRLRDAIQREYSEAY